MPELAAGTSTPAPSTEASSLSATTSSPPLNSATPNPPPAQSSTALGTSKAIICLVSSTDGIHLVSGSEDGMIRVWDTRKRNIIHIFRHAKGPINNVLILRQPPHLNPASTSGLSSSAKKHGYPLPPPLKYTDSSDGDAYIKAFIGSRTPNYVQDASYRSTLTTMNQIKELRQQGSSVASEMLMDRLKLDCNRSMQMIKQWENMYENLHQYCVSELLKGVEAENVQKQQK